MCNDRLRLSNPLVHKYDPETSSFSITWEVVTGKHCQGSPRPPRISSGRGPATCFHLPSGVGAPAVAPAPRHPLWTLRFPVWSPAWGRTLAAGSLQSVPSSAVQSHFLRMHLSALEQFQPQDTGTPGRRPDTLTQCSQDCSSPQLAMEKGNVVCPGSGVC